LAEVIGAAIISSATAASVGATIGVSAAVVTTGVGALALLTGGVALNVISTALSGDPNKVAAQQFQSRQPLPTRTLSYGTVKVGGAFVQYRSVGAFKYGLYHGEGPWQSFKEWWLDEIQCRSLVSGSLGGVVTDVPWRKYVAIESHLGAVPQTASALLQGTGGWDADHRLDGCAYSAVTNALPSEKKFKNYYPKQTWSNLRVVAQATICRSPYDPNAFFWSDRSAVCIFDIITNAKWGLRIPVDMMNLPKWQAFNDLCNQNVTSKAGVVQPRYFLGGTHNLNEDLADTLSAMLATCDGELTLEDDGTIGVRGGKAPVSGFTITDAMVTSVAVEAGGPMLVAFNRLKCNYVSPDHDYQQIEGQPWDDLSSQAKLGEILEEDFSRPWVQNFNQVRRLAKIAMAKGNPEYKLTLVTTLQAAPAAFEEAVTYSSGIYPAFANLLFLVRRCVVNVAAGTMTLELASLDPACYSFNAATEEGQAPALPTAHDTPVAPSPPQNPSVTIERKTVSGSTNATFLRLTARAPDGRQDLSLLGRYRVAGSDAYLDMVQDGDDSFSLTSGVLQDGAQYDVEAAVSTYGQVLVSDYVDAVPNPITAIADTTSTGPPTGFAVNGGVGQVMGAFTAPNTPNFSSAKLYRATSPDFTKAVVVKTFNGSPSQAFDWADAGLSPGSYTYWARAINGSGFGDASSTTDPQTVTVA
jgi:hypothetical protein